VSADPILQSGERYLIAGLAFMVVVKNGSTASSGNAPTYVIIVAMVISALLSLVVGDAMKAS
jgi:hypothetical protein